MVLQRPGRITPPVFQSMPKLVVRGCEVGADFRTRRQFRTQLEIDGKSLAEVVRAAGCFICADELDADSYVAAGQIAPAQVAERLQAFVDLGVTYLIVRLLDFPNTAGIELFIEEVMPRLAVR